MPVCPLTGATNCHTLKQQQNKDRAIKELNFFHGLEDANKALEWHTKRHHSNLELKIDVKYKNVFNLKRGELQTNLYLKYLISFTKFLLKARNEF